MLLWRREGRNNAAWVNIDVKLYKPHVTLILCAPLLALSLFPWGPRKSYTTELPKTVSNPCIYTCSFTYAYIFSFTYIYLLIHMYTFTQFLVLAFTAYQHVSDLTSSFLFSFFYVFSFFFFFSFFFLFFWFLLLVSCAAGRQMDEFYNASRAFVRGLHRSRYKQHGSAAARQAEHHDRPGQRVFVARGEAAEGLWLLHWTRRQLCGKGKRSVA